MIRHIPRDSVDIHRSNRTPARKSDGGGSDLERGAQSLGNGHVALAEGSAQAPSRKRAGAELPGFALPSGDTRPFLSGKKVQVGFGADTLSFSVLSLFVSGVGVIVRAEN